MSITELKDRSRQVRDENQLKANTATRIGQILMDIIDTIASLVTSSHSHNNKTVVDQLTDNLGGNTSTSGGKLQYRGQTIETSAPAPSLWVDPPVLKLVSVLPSTPTEGDRYIYTPNGRIFEWITDSWVIDSQTDPNPAEGSVVLVKFDNSDQVLNHWFLYTNGAWVDKDEDYNSNNQRYVTSWDTIIGRKLIPLVGSPDNITQTGLYSGKDNVIGNPIYDAGLGLYTDMVYYAVMNHEELSVRQEAFVNEDRYLRNKINGVWGDWKLHVDTDNNYTDADAGIVANTSGTNTGDEVHIGTDAPTGGEELWIDPDEEGMSVYTQTQINNINNAHKPWLTSGHTGTANKIAGFDENGDTAEYSQDARTSSNQSTGNITLALNTVLTLTTSLTNTNTIAITPEAPTDFTVPKWCEVFLTVGVTAPSITWTAPNGVTFQYTDGVPTGGLTVSKRHSWFFDWESDSICIISRRNW